MTYRFIESIMRRVEREYNEVTCHDIENKVNGQFNIKEASMEVYRRVEDYYINRLVIKSFRKHNKFAQVHKALCVKMNTDIADKIVREYLDSHDHIKVVIDIHYDPLEYPLGKCPSWKLCEVQMIGLNPDIELGIQHMIRAHNQVLEDGWSPAICFRTDLAYFMSKYCKLLKYI